MIAPTRWYVGYTKPRQEARAAQNLLRQGFECHMPVIRLQKRVRQQMVWREDALFPRYVFLRSAPGAAPLARVRSTLGVSGLVGFSGVPATVTEELVEEPVNLGSSSREVLFALGQKVRLLEGPLPGLEFVFEYASWDEGAIRAVRIPKPAVQCHGFRVRRSHGPSGNKGLIATSLVKLPRGWGM